MDWLEQGGCIGWLEILALVAALAFIGWLYRTEYRWRVRSLRRETVIRRDDGGGT